MVQEEVGRRFTGKPHTKEYGSFTVFLNFYSNPKYAFTVSPHCFYPEPKVKSAVVQIKLKEPPLADAEGFFKLTRTAFEHRRKMMRASLKLIYDPSTIEEALKSIGITPQARPEELSMEEFVKIYNYLHA
jgi:16S rRNA (adenine1518-N6/adenine1519-N6)-dimethyltransferase